MSTDRVPAPYSLSSPLDPDSDPGLMDPCDPSPVAWLDWLEWAENALKTGEVSAWNERNSGGNS